MRNKGILELQNEKWMVKWSDLHSFGNGTHWMYTELSPESNVIKYLDSGDIVTAPLEEGLNVDFEHITLGYNGDFTPNNIAELVFPEVEEFEKEQWIKEYVIRGNLLFSITDISTMRDGGTIILYNRGTKQKPFYIHKDNWTLHNDYPTTDENIVTDKPTWIYVLDRLRKHKKDCKFNLKQVNNIIEKIKI